MRALGVMVMNLAFILISEKASAAWISVALRQVQACLAGMFSCPARGQSERSHLGGTLPCKSEAGLSA